MCTENGSGCIAFCNTLNHKEHHKRSKSSGFSGTRPDFLVIGNTVKRLLSGHLWDLPKCPFNRGCPLNRSCKNCVMFVNDQHSPVTL